MSVLRLTWSDIPAVILFDRFSKQKTNKKEVESVCGMLCVYIYIYIIYVHVRVCVFASRPLVVAQTAVYLISYSD